MTSNDDFNAVGIVGYGRFGKLLAQELQRDFAVRAYDQNIDVFSSADDAIHSASLSDAASSDAVFFAVPIISFENALRLAAPYFKPNALVMDTCSVKLHPEQAMARLLPKGVYGLPLHPMFGPDSAKEGWRNLPMVFCPNADASAAYQRRVMFWRKYFSEKKGCRVIEMTSETHDRITAYSLCLTQLLGRALGNMGIESSEIDAQTFKHLLSMKTISYNDSMELLLGLHQFNPFAKEMRARLKAELEQLDALMQK